MQMVDLGHYCLYASLALCAYALAAGVVGVLRRETMWVRSAENAVVANLIGLSVATASLLHLILNDQFQVGFVARVSSTTIPLIYKITALWGGQSGSLLIWTLILGLLAAVAVLQNRRRHRDMMPYVTMVLSGVMLFFMILVAFVSNPFKLLEFAPPEGTGLNPLLQNYWMAIHPPILYVGMISLTVPFAFAMGALMSKKLDVSWIPVTRRWSLFSWCFLTPGFTLGGIWAYEELGWGGYWAWDPVENASFMPWLALTAFLHSVMITEKKGMLKIWNFFLILLAFELTIFGTFITRSGVIQSVHAFALSNIGPWFATFLGISSLFGLYLLAFRSKHLKSEGRLHSFLSREATFLLNNWLFLAICFAIFWGTVFPMVSEAVTGEKITVSAPFFNKVTWPLGLGLLALTGVCPLIAWRKASSKNFKRNFLYPLVGGAIAGAAAFALGSRGAIPLAFFSASGFVAATIFFEFYKGARARQTIRPSGFAKALTDLTLMNKRRYGGFVIHAGAVIVFVGIIASSFYQRESVYTVQVGESFTMERYNFRLLGVDVKTDSEKAAHYAWLEASQGREVIGRFYPQVHRHFKQDQTVSEVSIRSTFLEDIYVVLSGWDEEGNVTFRVFINPLVNLVWLGITIMVLGGVFVMTKDRRPWERLSLRGKDKQEQVAEAA